MADSTLNIDVTPTKKNQSTSLMATSGNIRGNSGIGELNSIQSTRPFKTPRLKDKLKTMEVNDFLLKPAFEGAFTQILTSLASSNESYKLETFQQDILDHYVTSKNKFAILKEDWLAGLSSNEMAVSSQPSIAIAQATTILQQKIVQIEALQDLVVLDPIAGHRYRDLVAFQSEAKIKRPTESNKEFKIKGLLMSPMKNSHFKPRKNPVIATVDHPGILEVDWSPHGKRVATTSSAATEVEIRLPIFPGKWPKNALKAEPPQVVFDDFIPHKDSIRKLVIKNTSNLAIRVRASFTQRPRSFKLTICDTPLPQNGLIAPGLYCSFLVQFTPTSFANQTEYINISGENGESFIVPVIAAKEKAFLPIPKIVDIGYCMENRDLNFKMELFNSGGDGRFILQNSHNSIGAFELFEEIGPSKTIKAGLVCSGPFTLSPSFIYTTKNNTTELEIHFDAESPIENLEKKQSKFFKYFCDNLDEIEFLVSVTVQRPRLQITSCLLEKDGTMLDLPLFDPLALLPSMAVNFGEENVGVPKICIITVENPTNLSIPFNWIFANNQERLLSFDMQPVLESMGIFKISPATGMFQPLETMKFVIQFESSDAANFVTDLELVIPKEDSTTIVHKRRAFTERKLINLQLLGSAIPYYAYSSTSFIFLPQSFKMGDPFSHSIYLTNASLSPMAFSWSLRGTEPGQFHFGISPREGVVQADTCIYVKLQLIANWPGNITGELVCICANGLGPTLRIPIKGAVKMQPGILSFSCKQRYLDLGLLKLGDIAEISVPLRNSSTSPLKYCISVHHRDLEKDCYIKINPATSTVDANSHEMITITYVPLWFQHLRATIEVYGELHNACISNQNGRFLLSAIDLIAKTETPHLMIENDTNSICCYSDVAFKWSFFLKNTRDLKATFYFPNSTYDGCSFTFLPSTGTVDARGTIEIFASAKPLQTGTYFFNLHGIAYDMVENSGNLSLTLELHVNGPKFSFLVEENLEASKLASKDIKQSKYIADSDASLRIDFGIACPIFGTKDRTIKIRNKSPCQIPFEVAVERFTPKHKSVTTDGTRPNESDCMGTRYTLKTKTPQLLQSSVTPRYGFSSKAGQQYVDGLASFRSILETMKRILADGKGAAFDVTPTAGEIQPWSQATITVRSYNNMVGIYEDWINFNVGSYRRRLPVRMVVVGIPIKLTGPQLVMRHGLSAGNLLSQYDFINFGSRVVNPNLGTVVNGIKDAPKLSTRNTKLKPLAPSLAPIHVPTKAFTVENHCPREIKLDWTVYINFSDNSEETNLERLMRIENRIKKDETGVIGIVPRTVTIPPFKSAVLQCQFFSCNVGFFDAVLVSDIGYPDSNGVLKYGPTRIKRCGDMPQEAPIITSTLQTLSIKELDGVAKLRIKAKCIEPKLCLDMGEKIRLKKNLLKASSIESAPISTVQFLVNQSDAVCSFTLKVIPEGVFSIQPSKLYQTDASLSRFQLKQKQQMMINVTFYESTRPNQSDEGTTFGSSQKRNSSSRWNSVLAKGNIRYLIQAENSRKTSIEASKADLKKTMDLDTERRSSILALRKRLSAQIVASDIQLTPPRRDNTISTDSDSSKVSLLGSINHAAITANESLVRQKAVSSRVRNENLPSPHGNCGNGKLSRGNFNDKTKQAAPESSLSIAEPQIGKGELQISYSNGMTQIIEIIVEGVYE